MVTESYIQTAPDSLGKKVRTVEETVGENTVHTPVTILEDGAGAIISPAKETGGNLATIATNTTIPTQTETYSENAYLTIDFPRLTWSDYTQIIASTNKTTQHIRLYTFGDQNSPNGLGYIQIATGSAGSEVMKLTFPWVTNAYGSSSAVYYDPLDFDLTIPAGSRVSVRCYAVTASGVLRFSVFPLFMEG